MASPKRASPRSSINSEIHFKNMYKASFRTIYLLLPLVFVSIALAYRSDASSLSSDDQKKIAQIVLEQGLKDSKPSPADNCSIYLLNNLKALFLSSKNLPTQFTPKLSGFHVVIESPKDIEKNIQDNKKHCWIGLGEMVVTEKEVSVTFTKKIETQLNPNGVRYVFEETLHYSFTKVKGKWVGELKKRSSVES